MIPNIVPVNNWAGNSSTTTFDFDFLINNESELTVVHTASDGTQTTLTLNVDYVINRVAGESDDEAFPMDEGSITFPITGSAYNVLSSTEKISLILDIPCEQSSPYGTSTKLDLKALEYSLDYLTRLIQICQRKLERSVKIPEGNNISTDQLAVNLTKVADIASQVTTVAGSVANVVTVAGSISNVNTVGNDITNVNAVAGDLTKIDAVADDLTNIDAVVDNETNINTVATNISDVNSVADDITKVAAVADDLTNIDAVEADLTNIDAVAEDLTNIDAVAADLTNIDAVVDNETNINTVATNIADVNDVADDIVKVAAVADDLTNIDAVVDNETNINTVATNISDVNSVAGDIAKVTAVADDLTNIDAVNANKTNIDAVAGNATNINAVNANKTNIDAVAGNATNINTVATNISDIGDVADDLININAVASDISNIDAVAGDLTNIDAVNSNKTNIDAVAGNATNINAVNSNKTNIDAVAGNATNINAVAGSISNVNSVAADLTNIDAVAADLTNIDAASSYADLAEDWATKMDGPVDGTEYSAKYYAQQAAGGQVQANWNETDTTSKSYIQNKPDFDLTLHNKNGVPSTSFVDSRAGTTTYPTAGTNLNNSLVIGDDAYFTGTGESYQSVTLIGNSAKGDNSYQTAIGKQSYCSNTNSTAVGYDASAGATYGTALGASSRASNIGAVAIGYSASAPTQYSTAVGYSASTSSNSHNIALGANAAANAQYATVVGASAGASASALRGTVLGYGSGVTQQYAVAIGSNATASAQSAAQIGSGTNSTPGTLQFRSWQLLTNNGFIPLDRIPDVLKIAGINPPNLYQYSSSDSDDIVDQSIYLWTGETNSLFIKDQFYKGKVNYAKPEARCDYTNSDYIPSQKDVIIDQDKFFRKLVEISQDRIDNNDTANSVVGGDNSEQQIYIYYNGDSQQWWVEFSNNSIESGDSDDPDTYYFASGETLADFGIYINNLNLPTDDNDEEILDIAYYAPVYCDGIDYDTNDFTIDYMKFIDAMCSNNHGFGYVISNLQTWSYMAGTNTYSVPILPTSYTFDSTEYDTVEVKFEYNTDFTNNWSQYINGELLTYEWTTADLEETFGIDITGTASDVGYINLVWKPARQCNWEHFNPVDYKMSDVEVMTEYYAWTKLWDSTRIYTQVTSSEAEDVKVYAIINGEMTLISSCGYFYNGQIFYEDEHQGIGTEYNGSRYAAGDIKYKKMKIRDLDDMEMCPTAVWG